MSESNCACPAEKPSGSAPRVEARLAVAHQQRAGLEQVAARLGRQLVARARWPSPPSTCTHARTAAHGAAKATWRRVTPRVRSSPSGTPLGG